MILLYVKCAHCCNTSLAQACGRKPKARKNACPQEGSGDQRAECASEGKNDVSFENEQDAKQESNDKKAQVVDDSDLKKETADLKNEEAANSKVETQTTSKGGRPKRAPKSVKEEVSAAENEVKGDQTKQNSELESEKPNSKDGDVAGESGQQLAVKAEVDFDVRDERHAVAKSVCKRGRAKKNEGPKDDKAVSSKKEEGKAEVTKSDGKMSKRVGRGTKRLADGKDADGAEEGGEREVESHDVLLPAEDLSEFRCVGHQIDKETGKMHFKLSRGRKMKLVTVEEAKSSAMEACFDYMVQKIIRM
ncbi:unnamed protein product [Enterobius vermicularis]|uniref:RanBD1 domain-containing protein n=1 Tax=Enterobius vermicularis TaxID=51028 RepID=A0A0N4V003_ENTVE|nr:unnamed protein product [Enterobius vermicularis]